MLLFGQVAFQEDLNFLYEENRHPLYKAFNSLVVTFKARDRLKGLFGYLAVLWYMPLVWRLWNNYDTIIGGLLEGKLHNDAPSQPVAPIK